MVAEFPHPNETFEARRRETRMKKCRSAVEAGDRLAFMYAEWADRSQFEFYIGWSTEMFSEEMISAYRTHFPDVELGETPWWELPPELAQEPWKADINTWLEEGFCQKELQPSFLGLDWASFQTRQFTESPDEIRFWNSPEFVYYGFSALDAYATAMLAADSPFDSLGALNFICQLIQPDAEYGLRLGFRSLPEHGTIDSDRVMVQLLSSFPQLLGSKGIDGGAFLFLEGEGCPMMCEYPGRMKSGVSRFLRDRSMDLWPEVTVTLIPTSDLRTRSQKILAFLRDSESTAGEPS